MKAVCIREHGGIDKLLIEDLPEPEPGPGEVKVAVDACALNHLDLWIRRGLPGLRLRYPHILGSDVAGRVAAVGPGISGVAPGTPVLLNPGLSCGRCRECLSGDDNLCRDYGILGETRDGGCAEQVVVPVANLLPYPAGMPPEQAAALPLVFLTAWQMLVRRARVRPGESVLVLGAGSGVGTAAIQIARLLGAEVIAASTSADKLEPARGLGAAHTIDLSAEDLLAGVRRVTGKRGVDVVVEHVGAATWEKSILCAARGGRVVTCGATTGFEARTDLRQVFFRQLQILGSTMGSKADLFAVLGHVAAGKLRPVVDCVLPLEQAAQAHHRLEGRKQFGKVVLRVAAAGPA